MKQREFATRIVLVILFSQDIVIILMHLLGYFKLLILWLCISWMEFGQSSIELIICYFHSLFPVRMFKFPAHNVCACAGIKEACCSMWSVFIYNTEGSGTPASSSQLSWSAPSAFSSGPTQQGMTGELVRMVLRLLGVDLRCIIALLGQGQPSV